MEMAPMLTPLDNSPRANELRWRLMRHPVFITVRARPISLALVSIILLAGVIAQFAQGWGL